ncbi:amidohydrolase family protein [Sphingomonas sp. MMS24-J13]|uniref:Xaa-Pro dipeptidase n=1 Tax=Sphingomonas sp. MMS24-J13 TaxID=3238686 RepID=UPI00384E8C82
MKLTIAALGLLIATGAPAATVVTAAHLFDPVKGLTLDNPIIVVDDKGRVQSLVTGNNARPNIPADAKRIDLGDVTILPGLIDMHVHLTADPTLSGYQGLEYTDNFWTVVGVANAKKTLEAGFTTVRNVGSSNYDDVAIKQAIEHGYVAGPRIMPATYAIGATGGHCNSTEFPPSVKVDSPNIANSPEGFRALVRTLRKYGAEVIKVCMTGGVLSKTDSVGAQQLSYEEIKAIVDEAHMLGLRVAIHAHGTAGINDGLRAGVDTIEHASLADDESFKLAKAHGAWFTMDIYDDDYILAEGAKNGVFAESLAKEKAVGLKQRQTFRAAHAAGVKLIFGTDAGVYPNGLNARQFAKMVEWGMTPVEAIRAATSEAAIALNRADDVGQLTPGHYADIVAVSGDPTRDVRLLEKPTWVLKGGQVVTAPGR